ncbi:Na(+)/H(+) antiporter subunit B [Aquibacillus sediminis]|uniref:Na(+)/H(+) antiporter subunit B n=1 Tax=Aquibacillus sediminis TaxID=2574734 RepID=UPI0011080D1F|nr:Na(+)/H(+) antiporter subunit B [Aquibacillus sediminis]
MKNNVSLQTVTRLTVFIVLAFSIYLLLAGHHAPGGGFIGGLMAASAIVLLYLSFGMKKISKVFTISYPYLIAVGLLLAMGTGFIGVLVGDPFLTQYYDYFYIPFLGTVELTTALIFDIGVYFVVVGVALFSILTIAEDDA